VGYDPDFGARPLRRALQKHVEGPLAIRLLSGEFAPGDTIEVDVEEDKAGEKRVVFHKVNTEAAAT